MQVMKDIGGVELPESLIKVSMDDSPPPPASSTPR
jgi:hypothetical protein